MVKAVVERCAHEMEAVGFAPIKDKFSRIRWRVTCDGCGATRDHDWGISPQYKQGLATLTREGWRAEFKKFTCKACISKEKTVKHQTPPVQMSPALGELRSPLVPSVAPTPIGPDPKIARKIYGLLDDHFDEKTRRYKSPWSDEKIAAAADTALALVVRIRREAYGELAEDPVLATLRDDFELLRMELQDEIGKLKNKYDEQITQLQARLFKATGVK